MSDEWYYADKTQPRGPVARDRLEGLVREGKIERATLVWRAGLGAWVPASEVAGLFPPADPSAAADPGPPPVPEAAARGRGLLGGIGARISEVADLPTISTVPVRDILVGGLAKRTRAEEIEEAFAVGTRGTTPDLVSIPGGWPTPRVFWRVLGGALATYFLLRIGLTHFGNVNFFPGMIVIGSFVVPFSVVVLFFELNAPRNVSVYQVTKMLMLGGAFSLFGTLFLFTFIPGAGVGNVFAAMLTGIGEAGKALALLLAVGIAGYRWQLNGLLLGAAVGAGFAGFESAGYAFRIALQKGLGPALDNIMLRGLLAPGGHVIWTAMVGAAIWQVKGDRPFRIGMLAQKVVVRRFLVAVVLHGLWDSDFGLIPWQIKIAVLVVVGWYVIMAVLRQALAEVEEAKKAAVGAALTQMARA
jgi:RsiW-degrading membrane proteinase PrsW (M82 family)